jgi:hypothetical protein
MYGVSLQCRRHRLRSRSRQDSAEPDLLRRRRPVGQKWNVYLGGSSQQQYNGQDRPAAEPLWRRTIPNFTVVS